MACACFGWGSSSNKRRDAADPLPRPPALDPAAVQPDASASQLPTASAPGAADTSEFELMVSQQLETAAAGDIDLAQNQGRDLLAAPATEEAATYQQSTPGSSEEALALATQPSTPVRSKKRKSSATRATRQQSTDARALAWGVQDLVSLNSNELLEPPPSSCSRAGAPHSGSITSQASRPSARSGPLPFQLSSGFVLATLAAQQAQALAADSLEAHEPYPTLAASSPGPGSQRPDKPCPPLYGSAPQPHYAMRDFSLHIDPQIASRWAALGKPSRTSPTCVLSPSGGGPGPAAGAPRPWHAALQPAASLGSDRSTAGDASQLLDGERGTRETSLLSSGSGGHRMRLVQQLSDPKRSSSSSPPLSRALDAPLPQRSTLPALPRPHAACQQQPAARQLQVSVSMPYRRRSEMADDVALRAAAPPGPGAAGAVGVRQLRSRLSIGAISGGDAGSMHPPCSAQ